MNNNTDNEKINHISSSPSYSSFSFAEEQPQIDNLPKIDSDYDYENDEQSLNLIKKLKTPLKKYKSAYIIFCEQQRPNCIKMFPDFTSRKITAKLAELWRNLDPVSKQQYFTEQERQKKDFLEEKKKGAKVPYKTLRKKYKLPKRFKTAFMFFMHEKKDYLHKRDRPNNIEQIRELSRMWNQFNVEQKQKYVDLSEKDKERYYNECQEYLAKSIKMVKEKKKKKAKENEGK